ncbi:MAG: 4Fe-4S dicluster domain-containing protein [Elusimicrobiota bacterium]|nr:4Fe-4S dicluster domain-containing protein [Elusimicrobiota bacterium]
MEKIITKTEIDKLISEMISNYEIIAPVKEENLVLFKTIKKSEEILWDYANSLKPAKELFFPPREILFEYSAGGQFIEPVLTKNRIIFGIRPCDAHSLVILDKVFDGDYKDTYYLEKREKTILVGLACETPDKHCFCSSVDKDGPFSTQGLDILLIKLRNETYLAEIITEKGEKLLNDYGKNAGDSDIKEKNKLMQETQKKIVKNLTVPENLETIFENDFWDKVSRKCIACGICRYLCATCHCFSITDEGKERIKFHAACSFPSFTKEAAGTNPREKKVARYKQWYYHKFLYHKKKYGEYLCVGCGRCIRNCPVKIEFTEVLKNAKSIHSQSGKN